MGPSARETVLNAGSQAMKARAKRFFNNFPAREKPIFKIKLFIRLFALWYNFIRPHQTLKRPTSNTHNLTVSINFSV